MRFLTRSLVGIGLLAATLGLLAAAVWVISDAMRERMAAGGPGRPAEERVVSASVTTLQPGQVEPVLTAYGEVRAKRSLELRSPAGGTIIWLAEGFADGRAVQAGELLMRLDPSDAATARDLAASDLAKAQAEEAEAGRTLEIAVDELAGAEAQAALRAQALVRQNDLLQRGIGSDAAVETAALAASAADQVVLSQRQAVSQAETSVALTATATDRQRITLAEAERALADTELRAEFAGLLDGVSAIEGGDVTEGEVLGQLIDPATLEVSFRVSTEQFGSLADRSGALLPLPVTALLDTGADDLQAVGQLSRVGAAVGEGQTGRLIYASLDESPAFRPGDFVTLRVTEPALENAAVLPATAVGSGDALLALGDGDRLEELRVRVLRRQGDDVVIDAAGLDGREVILERSPLLGAGIRVRPVRDAGPDEMTALTDERRAALIAVIEADAEMPAADKARLLDQLADDRVPAAVIRDLEARAGG